MLSVLPPDEQPVGVAVINSIGNLGGFVGPVITGYLISLFKTLDSGWPVITFISVFWRGSDDLHDWKKKSSYIN